MFMIYLHTKFQWPISYRHQT